MKTQNSTPVITAQKAGKPDKQGLTWFTIKLDGELHHMKYKALDNVDAIRQYKETPTVVEKVEESEELVIENLEVKPIEYIKMDFSEMTTTERIRVIKLYLVEGVKPKASTLRSQLQSLGYTLTYDHVYDSLTRLNSRK